MRAPTELHPAPILERHIRSAEQERTYWVALPAMMVAGVPTFALAMMGAHPVLAAGILMGLTLLLVKATMIVWPPRHRVGWQPVPWMVDEHGVTLGGQAARSVYAPAPDANDPTTAVYVAPWEAISDVHLITHRDILAGMAQHAWARPHRRRHGQGALFAPYFPHPRAPMLVFRVDLAKARMPSLPPGVQPSEVWAIPVADRFEVRRRFAEHGVVVCRRPVIMVPLASAGRRRVHVDVSTTPPKRFPRSARRDLARRRQEAEAAVARRASHPLSAGTAPAVVEDRVFIDDLGITLGRGDVTGAGLSDQPSPAVWDVLCHAPLGALRDVQLVRSTWRLFRLQRNGVGGAVVLNEGRWVVNRPSFRWWRVQGALTFRVDPGRGYIPPELPAWVQRSDVWMVP
ncbi:MAG: hypothetical protein Q4G43_11290, partial [Mobilicoccus sp.]|nr:hypothetical protein [Mobilicoccus sp.]